MGCLIVLNKSANTATLIDLNTDQPIKVLPTGNGPHEMAVSPDGQMVAVSTDNRRAFAANIRSGSVSVIDLSLDKGNPMKIIPCGKGTEGLDVSPDGKKLWVSNRTAARCWFPTP